jgi:hypothetical protein
MVLEGAVTRIHMGDGAFRLEPFAGGDRWNFPRCAATNNYVQEYRARRGGRTP